jgi:hypothetical protein
METAIARGGGHRFFTRFLAAAALVAVYCLGTVGIVSTSGTPAFARGRGSGGGGMGRGMAGMGRGMGGMGRGMGRGRGAFFRGRGHRHFRGRGRGVGIFWDDYSYDGCWWSYRWQRWICPYDY